MPFKRAYVAPLHPPTPAFSIPGMLRVCCQHLTSSTDTSPGYHFYINIHVCMLTLDLENLGCGLRKSLPGHLTNFQKSMTRTKVFFFLALSVSKVYASANSERPQ